MRSFLFFLVFLGSTISWSQTVTYDTIVDVKEITAGVFDTTYYVQKHVQITEPYVVVDTVRGNQWAFDMYAGASVWSSNARYLAPDLTFKASQMSANYFGGSLYYNFPKNWSVRVGIKLEHQKLSAEYTKSSTYLEDVWEEVSDTLDTYYTQNGTIVTYIYVIETTVENRQEERTVYSDVAYNWEIHLLKIPVQVSYAYEFNRWNFNALVGTSLNFRLERFQSTTTEQIENKTSFFPSGIISLQAGYFVGNSTNIYIEPLFEKSFDRAADSVFSIDQLTIGFGFKQFF